MGGPYTVLKIVIILIILSGCLQNQSSFIIRDICCQNITDGRCVELRNVTNNQVVSMQISDGSCSDLARLCYNTNLSINGLSARVDIPYCRYANIDNCKTGFTMLVYDKYTGNQKVNYDFLIQKFMFNNTLPADQGEELKQKTPFNLLYGTLSRKFVGKYDMDKFNIYGTKFGVGDSILEYEHYKYFYPFDRDYQGMEGLNPIFYNIVPEAERRCELNNTKYTCAGREYETWESCLLMCEMPNTGRESMESFYRSKYNKSYGYEYIYSVYDDTAKILNDQNFYRLLIIIASLDRISERYPVGLFKTFAQPSHPNFFHKIYLNQSSLTTGGGLMTGCFLGIGLGFGFRESFVLNPGNYTAFVETGNISYEYIRNVNGKNIYRVKYNFILKLQDLNLTKYSQGGFLITFCTSSRITTTLTFNMTLSEIFIEEEYPMYIMQEIAKRYYQRFGFSPDNTSRPLIQRFDRYMNRYYNFTGLPFECIYEDYSSSGGTCSVEYYARYTCINASNNQSLDCWCDPVTCYAYYNYQGPMLNLKVGSEVKPSLTYNRTNVFESPEFIPRKTIKFKGRNAVVIPVNDNLDFNNYTLKKACFSGNNNEILVCDAITGGAGCPNRNEELWNITFKRYEFQFDDITYLKKVVILIEDGNGNYGDCKGIRVNKTVNNTTQEFLDLDIRIFGLPVPPNPSLNSIAVTLFNMPNQIEYSGKSTDNIKIAKYACAKPDTNYGGTYTYSSPSKQKYEYASFAFDDFGRLIGCYQGTVAMNRSLDGELLFVIRRDYQYGLYKHYPFTRDVTKYLMEGRQVIMFIDYVPIDYLKKVLREVDVFILANERIPRPFIKYSASPIGSVILVRSNPLFGGGIFGESNSYNTLKSICPTCLITTMRNMNIGSGNISYHVPDYNTRTEDISNNNLLSCPGVNNNKPSPQEDILFYIVTVNNAPDINLLISVLKDINKRSGGMPIYLYINGSSNYAKEFVDLLVNHSHNLSGHGVMGIHIGNMKDFMLKNNAYSSSMELSRSVLSSFARLPVLYQTENRSECSYVVDEQYNQPITCIPDPVPQVRTGDIFPTYNVLINRNNFARYSLEIATSNYYNDKTICIRAPDGRFLTYKLAKQYIKGANPVIYDEIGNRMFDFVEYRYNNRTNMMCLPANCSYRLESFCKPATCYKEGRISNIRGTVTSQISLLTINEEPHSPEQCIHRNFTLTLSGFGVFEGRFENPWIIQESCMVSPGYRTIGFGNTTSISLNLDNCSAASEGGYNNLRLRTNTTQNIPIPYTQNIYEVRCYQDYGSGLFDFSSNCRCEPVLYNVNVNDVSVAAIIRDDNCTYHWGNIYPNERNRTVTFSPIYDIVFYETYDADWCVSRFVLRCEE